MIIQILRIIYQLTIMRKDCRNDIQMKKQAFRNNIRKEWLQQHFRKIRESLQQGDRYQEEICDSVREMIEALPGSVMDLVHVMTESKSIVTSIVADEIEKVAMKMVRIGAVEWSHYVYIINQVIEGSFSKKEIERVVKHTLLNVLECGEVLAAKNKSNTTLYNSILSDCLEYLYHTSLFILDLDPMEENALSDIMIRIWANQQSIIEYQQLVFISNRILINSFDLDELENVSPQKETDLQIMRIRFITTIFYKNTEIIGKLVYQCIQHSIVEQNPHIHQYTLQLLINITRFLNKPSFYYPLLSSNVLVIVNSNLITHKQHKEIIIYTIRLLNNMLVNDVILTESILQEIQINTLIDVFKANEHDIQVQTELVELFINLIEFLNSNDVIVRELINLGVHVMMLELLSKMDDIDQTFLNQVTAALMVGNDCHPFAIQAALRDYQSTFMRIIEDPATENESFVSLIKSIFEERQFQAV